MKHATLVHQEQSTLDRVGPPRVKILLALGTGIWHLCRIATPKIKLALRFLRQLYRGPSGKFAQMEPQIRDNAYKPIAAMLTNGAVGSTLAIK
jgi:hypothetical protein